MIVMPITKMMEIIVSIQVYLISQWTLIMRKKVERKAFRSNPKHQYHAFQWEEHDCGAQNKKNGDFYDYPSLSHFLEEH